MKKIYLVFLLCFLLAGCSKNAEDKPLAVTELQAETITEASTETITEITTQTTTVDEIRLKLESMPLDEKIGQMLMPAYRYEGGSGVTSISDRIRYELSEYKVGNVVLFDENMAAVGLTKELTADYKSIIGQNCGIEPFISIDEEGGAVSRLGKSGIISDYYVPSARVMAKNGTAAENYTNIALNLKALGFNMDLAPDADVDTNPANPIIGDRAFSSDPDEVSENMLEAAKTLEQNGIIPVIKHFPGHGDTQTDSHLGMAVVPHDMARMESTELVPFKYAIENDIPAIMVGHLTTPQLSDNGLPASLNPDIIQGLLRDKLGFDGVVITDAMDMGAIENLYGNDEAAVMSVKAGADILLMPPDVPAAFEAVKNAVENGEISRENIDDSVYRILKLKWRLQQ